MADDKPKAVRGPGGKFVKYSGKETLATDKTPAPEARDDQVAAHPETGYAPSSFPWAAEHIVNGRTVRRASWIGNKAIGTEHPSRNMLENEDFLANDWVLV